MKRFLIVALTCFAAFMHAEDSKTVQHPDPPQECKTQSCLPGERVEVTVSTTLDTKAKPILTITLNPSKANSKPSSTPVVQNGNNFSFFVPKDLDEDTYTLGLKQVTPVAGAADKVDDITGLVPSQISVVRPVITAVSPGAAFLTDVPKANTFAILGKGFLLGKKLGAKNTDLRQAQDDNVRFHFTLADTPPNCVDSNKTDGCYKLTIDSDQQVTLQFINLDNRQYAFSKAESFVITVYGFETAPSSLTLIDTSEGTPKTVAVVGFLLLLVIIYLLLRSCREATEQKMKDGKTFWLGALFLDVPTNTYSLSKCQFYAWTGASVIGYLFLAISKNYVQGSGVFPDIPSGLPGILIASAGTAVISTGIASAKGDKGAGNPGPNLSDFIASGGVVAADRLQFVIWTVIGIATFLSVVFQSDPRVISDLPPIPPGFLQLMGISSAGYLAGKLARKAGPTISAMLVTSTPVGNSNPANPIPAKVRFEITGSGLSRSAMFSIDDSQIFPDMIVGDKNEKGPQILKQDPVISDLDYGSVLTFTVPNPPANYFGKRKFTITNPDAQKAVYVYQTFQVDNIVVINPPAPAPPAPPAVAPPAPSTKLTITGACLDANLIVKAAYGGNAAVNVTMVSVDPATYVGAIPGNPVTAGIDITVTVADAAGSVIQRIVRV